MLLSSWTGRGGRIRAKFRTRWGEKVCSTDLRCRQIRACKRNYIDAPSMLPTLRKIYIYCIPDKCTSSVADLDQVGSA